MFFLAPGVPENFTVVKARARNVTFSWSPPSTLNGVITGYTLNYSNDSTSAYSVSLDADEEMVTVDNLNEFTQYTFELRASTRVGFGPRAVVNQTTAQAVPSAAPLNVTGEFNDSRSLNISWTPPPFLDQNGIITGYNVTYERADVSDSVTELSATDRFILIADLTPFTNYSVRVAARTAVGAGPFSPPITVQTDSDSKLFVHLTYIACMLLIVCQQRYRTLSDLSSLLISVVKF